MSEHLADLRPDIDPVRREDRKWGIFSLIAYWASDSFSVAQLELASSILALGLSPRDALIIIALSYLILGFVIALNGATGVLYHVPFPVLSRASWGFWGSYCRQMSSLIPLNARC